MGIEILVGLVVFAIVLCLIALKTDLGKFLSDANKVNVAEMLDALATGVVVATKMLSDAVPLNDETTRKYLLAMWYWYAFWGAAVITEGQRDIFVEAWDELPSELKDEMGEAFNELSIIHRDYLEVQISSILRKKNVDLSLLKTVLCKISDKNSFLEHCSCEAPLK